MNDIFNPYKVFYFDNIKVTALGDLDKELGDELRAFKFDVVIYIPSNKNNGVMNFFADYFFNEFNIKKLDCIKIKKDIKEQKFLNTLKERNENIKDAFEIIGADNLRNKNVLLIDDVYASGETLKEVIRLLKEFSFSFNLECLIFCYRNYIFK